MTSHDLRELLRQDLHSGARRLLGCRLVRGACRAQIVEVEAYGGADDPSSHAHRGPTPRNQIMFAEPGLAYVYFTYGMYWMLNVSALEEGTAAAVLIRAAEPMAGHEEFRARRAKARRDEDLLSGPGKLAQAFGITRAENGLDLFNPGSDLRLELGPEVDAIAVGTRIGLGNCPGATHPWRYMDAQRRRWISAPRPPA
ncbi:MAG TPA: DNA-3-methyladenine glycosylase [Fimbriimonadaceae bacterium]|nr:DNA-3-methyladenine glycosylase [Fimbriimonadaceae bacterium]HRJ34014.1 DNA-3-methyladenine glycosylase [Fimbriimonadaceae bacterium]